MQGDREKCLAAGMDDYLPKPFTQDKLYAVLKRWLPPNPRETAVTSVDGASSPLSQPPAPTGCSQAAATTSSAEAASAQASAIDRGAIDNIRALGKPNLLDKIIMLFCDDTVRLLETMRHAATQDDAKTLASAAHRLKSSSANVGAMQLAAMCLQTEKLGRDSRVDGAAALVADMHAEFQRVRLALETQRG
jgi:HPt (histidine-containing phosphotransfer) domain-containing protein